MKIRKVSVKRNATLIIFIAFILVQSITFASSALEETNTKYRMEYLIKEEAILSEEEQKTLDLINEYRKENGLSELKTFARLQEVARIKAEDLVKNYYFSHNSEALGTPFEMLEQNKIDYKIAGENLAGNSTEEGAVKAWIESRPHRKNLLEEEYKFTGICVTESPVFGKVYVQIFIG